MEIKDIKQKASLYSFDYMLVRLAEPEWFYFPRQGYKLACFYLPNNIHIP